MKKGTIAASSARRRGTPGTATGGLFFRLPDDIRTYTRKVFAHYHTFPLSFDNQPPDNDYYDNQYLVPTGEGGIHAAYGGFLRSRPLPTPPKGADYLVQNAKIEIQRAIDAGIDGFFANIVTAPGASLDRLLAVRDAASTYFPGFYVIPMIDQNGYLGTAPVATVAGIVNQFRNQPSSFVRSGAFVVGAFLAENATVARWSSIFSAMGGSVAFAPVFLNFALSGVTGQGDFPSITTISSLWGYGGDPALATNAPNYAATAASRGHVFMAPVQPQGVRPYAPWFDEAANTGSLRAHWAKAIGQDADYVQIVTWNDFWEGSHLEADQQNGYVNLDLTAYYSTRWKTGGYPTILSDVIYLSHRNQLTSSTPVFTSSSPMVQRSVGGMTTARNTVECLTFFKAATDMTVNVGGTTYNYTAPAGEFAQTYTLTTGTISASGSRSGTVVANIVSPIVVSNSPVVQDLAYYRFSSLRPTTDYTVPTKLA